MTGLYIHLPFCTKKCHYCDFVITTDSSERNQQALISALLAELQQTKFRYEGQTLDTLYFGGGTPSLLADKYFSQLLQALRETFDFTHLREFTVEMNPEDVNSEKLSFYKDQGVGRISLGVQTFAPELLGRLGRAHTVQDSLTAFNCLEKEGFQNTNIDLICRLPGQTVTMWSDSLKKAVELGSPHLSIYDLEIHSRTHFGVKQSLGTLQLPGEALHFEMMDGAISYLEDQGFEHYEISNFAKPGYRSKHNLKYWRNEEYFALGPGAYAHINGKRIQSAASVKRYFEKYREKSFDQPDICEVLTPRQGEIDALLTGMRLVEGMHLSRFSVIREELEENVKFLAKEKLLAQEGGRFWLTRRGRFLAEQTFAELIPD